MKELFETSIPSHSIQVKPAFHKIGKVLLQILLAVFTVQILYSGFDLIYFGASSLINRNFHEVVPGHLYRSGSMSHGALQSAIEKYHIKMVFDLRTTPSIVDKNGISEESIVQQVGANYIHTEMMTKQDYKPEDMLHLKQLFDNAERPVLIHCSSGAERTGLAVAIWLMTEEGYSVDAAAGAIHMSYGASRTMMDYKKWRFGQSLYDTFGKLEKLSHQKNFSVNKWLSESAHS